MAELTASMTRRTITATITGLSEEHTVGRTYHWYLDGTLVKSESVTAVETSRTYAFNGVSYLAQHTVVLQINNYADETELGTFSATVDDTMHLWSWTASNGNATAEQTQAAYTAITTRGRTKNFNYLVWNDLVETLADALTVWNPGYASISEVLMEASGSALTAVRFNSVVQNIGNPWMFWAYQTDRKGYLGRLEVHGKAQYGAGKDKVYGAYLIELAKMLNVLIDAEGEFNAGYAKRMGHTNAVGLYTSDYLSMIAPMCRRLGYNGSIYAYRNNMELVAQGSRNIGSYLGNINLVANNPKMIAPIARAVRHSGSVGLSQGYAKMIAPTAAWLAYTMGEALNVSQNLPLLSLPYAKMEVTTTETLTSASETALDLAASLRMQREGNVSLKTAFAASMQTGLWEFLEFVGAIAASGVSGLSLAESLRIAIDHTLKYTGSHELFLSPSLYLNIEHGLASGQDAKLSPVPSERLNIEDTLDTAPDTELSPVPSERLTVDNELDTVTDVELAPTPSRRMDVAETLGKVDAELHPAPSDRMELEETLGKTEIELHPAPSDRMSHEETLGSAEIEFHSAASRRMVHEETLGKAEVEFDSAPSERLALEEKLGKSDIDFDASFSEYLNIDHALVSVPDAELSPDPSERLTIENEVTSGQDAKLSSDPSKRLTIEDELASEQVNAEFASDPSKRLVIDKEMTTQPEVGLSVRDSASLSLVSVPIAFVAELETYFEWVKRNGTDLHIRAAWILRTDGDNLQIDMVDFYEPVQDGSNLYIQSVWFSYQNNNGVDIDLDGIFYSPVQDGSDLYIQSVYAIWLEDSEANVDADFFI